MAVAPKVLCALIILTILAATALSDSDLSPYYYYNTCPQALPAVKRVVEEAIMQERRMGASLLRLHFHDCFVNGCDGSILLDSTSSFTSEKFAAPNNNSARGFEVIDRIKWEVDRVCGRPVVSCADILAVAARDSVVALGGPSWEVKLGRRDSTAAYINLANSDIPAPSMDLTALIGSFQRQGLSLKDLVALSGGHTIGFSQCRNFRNRIYNESNIDSDFAQQRRMECPISGGDSNLSGLDSTSGNFDAEYYYEGLTEKKGLLHSDQQLFNGNDETEALVRTYSEDFDAFAEDFASSMIKMGDIKVLTGEQGQVRYNCRRVN